MVAYLISECTEACGWAAALVAVLSWGSFGVPIKSVKVEAHPLVLQSFKTLVCFSTSWLVVLLGEEVRWSNWGILSGLFWVPGASCGIYAIRNAGIAVAVGTWSSIIVMTSFVFGLIIFQESVKDFLQSCLAFSCLIIGLVGMSQYSAPRPEKDNKEISSESEKDEKDEILKSPSSVRKTVNNKRLSSRNLEIQPLEIEPLIIDENDSETLNDNDKCENGEAKNSDKKERFVYFGGRISLTRYEIGVLGAVVNGAWGGMNLIPLHYALRTEGMTSAGYIISYGGGSLIVNIALWLILFGYYMYQKKGVWQDAIDALPDLHLGELFFPGLMAGMLYSLGNFASIIAVAHLGQGTGYSICQMQLFVSGLWGVFYFKEIKGKETIYKWFLSAAVAVIGITWLSYEHVGQSNGHR